MKSQNTNKSPSQVAEFRRSFGLFPEDADFLMGWSVKTWIRLEKAAGITDEDLKRLSKRAHESDFSIADPKELKKVREQFGLPAEKCDRLLGKTATWWGNHERGVVKTFRFYIQELIDRASNPANLNLSGDQLKISEHLKSERIRVGLTCKELNKMFAGKISRWDRLEAYGIVSDAELVLINKTLSRLPTVVAEIHPSVIEIMKARVDAGFSKASASKLMERRSHWWFHCEHGKAKMKQSELDLFIERAIKANASRPKIASLENIKVARFCAGLTQKEASGVMGKYENWWGYCEVGQQKISMGMLLSFIAKVGLTEECLSTPLPKRPIESSELRSARIAMGMTIKTAAGLMGKNLYWWRCRERGRVKTQAADITAFVEAAKAINEAKPKNAIPSEIKAARLRLNMSQREISRHINRSFTWWSVRERGVFQMPEDLLRSLIKTASEANRSLQ